MSKQEKFYNQARIAFQRIKPEKDDVIAITMPVDMAYDQVLATVTYIQEIAEEFGCNVIILSQGANVEILSEEDMNKLGWYRKENRNFH